MPKQFINDTRYSACDVLSSGEIEINSFDELYAQNIAQKTIFEWHHANFYHIFFFRGEHNVHCLNSHKIAPLGDCIVIVNRGTLQRYSRQAKCQGDMVLFSRNFFNDTPERVDFLNQATIFMTNFIILPLYLSDEFAREVNLYFEFLKNTKHNTSNEIDLMVIRNYLHNLLIAIERENRRHKRIYGDLTISDDNIVKFSALLNEHWQTEKQVSFYAGLLGIPDQKLSQETLQKHGITAKEFINEKMLEEAMRLLKNTTLNQGEIAHELGFDFTYFVKFFRRHTGYTPAKYQKMLNEK